MRWTLPVLIAFILFISAFLLPAVLCAEKKQSWKEEPSEKISPALLLDTNLLTSKDQLKVSIAHSLEFLAGEKAKTAYNQLASHGITLERVSASVKRFDELLDSCSSYQELAESISREFILIRPGDKPGAAAVKFTGYFQPTYQASRTKNDKFRFPVYMLPEDFEFWPKPQPRRIYLEGYNGEGNRHSPLHGRELAFLPSRWEAFMLHVQGSAILSLTDGSEMAVGFAGATDYPFKGVSRSFMQEHNVSWGNLGKFFSKNPDYLNQILSKNNRFIFFKENPNPLPIGSLGVPVIPERSIATDKSIMPPAALGVIKTTLPYVNPDGSMQMKPGLRFALDQDTGSAIKGTTRVDIFMGTGPIAQKKANAVYSTGEMYYLLLRQS